jgi:flagellar basal-body rod protein FlgB
MIDRMFGSGSLPALEAMMSFSSARQKVIAANIANVDTVGYKAKDVPVADFEKALAKAFERQKTSPSGAWTLERQGGVRPAGSGVEARALPARDAGILKHIENNVDLELEMAKMVKNHGMHTLAASLLAHQFSVLREAVGERVIG